MTGSFVSMKDLSERPSTYSNLWIQSVARLKSNPYYSCIHGGPKYIIRLDSPTDVEIRLAIWEKTPDWLPFRSSSPELWAILKGIDNEHKEMQRLFHQGAEVFFQGYAKYSQEILWINIKDILIAEPTIPIGPREVIGVLQCERIYYLNYVKNITQKILKIPNKKISKGNLVHYITQHILVDNELRDFYQTPKSEQDRIIRARIRKEMETTFRIDAALHHLAQTPLEDVQEETYNQLKKLFDDPEVLSFFEGKKIEAEQQLNQIYGFNGIVDFILDGKIPVEMKTSWNVNKDHILQLKIYLLASFLESGQRTGYLFYSQKAAPDGESQRRHIHEITLSDEDITQILYARHKALLLRKNLSLPTTLGRNCTKCRFAIESGHFLRNLYPPCQFYCQVERYWDCAEIGENGKTTSKCQLFDKCPVKFSYFDTAILDRYSKMRKAIMAEGQELEFLSQQIQTLPNEVLIICGQRVDHLILDEFKGYMGIFSCTSAIPSLDVVPGDSVIISTPDRKFQYLGILMEYNINKVTILFSGKFHKEFFSYAEYSLVKNYHEKGVFRYLLKAIDYTQRNRRKEISDNNSRKRMLEKRNVHPYNPEKIAHDLRKKRVVALHSPGQVPDTKKCAEVVCSLPRPSTSLVILKNPLEIEEFLSYYPKNHEILILNRVENFPHDPRPFEIGENDLPEDIAAKFERSPVIVTDVNFLKFSHLFEFLKHPQRSVFFDYVIITGAEQYFEPFFLYLRNFGYHTLMIGDAYRVAYPVRSQEARHLGLSFGPFERLVTYDSYFDSSEFSLYGEPFKTLPLPVAEALAQSEIDLKIQSYNGSVTFIDVAGIESQIKSLTCSFSLKMGDSSLLYALGIAPEQPLDLSSIESLLNALRRESIHQIKVSSLIRVGTLSFTVVSKEPLGNTPDSGENVNLVIHMPVQFSETLQELLYSNEQEVQTVINLIKSDTRFLKDTAVITPFISQASRLREALFKEGVTDIPVMVPLQASGTNYRTVIVSLVNANEERILRYPLTDLKTLYTILTSATENLILVGNKNMLEQSRIFARLIQSSHLQGQISHGS